MCSRSCGLSAVISKVKRLTVCPPSVYSQDGLLKEFVDDLQSGKLHREFHYGPDPVVQTQPPKPKISQDGQHVDREPAPSEQPAAKKPTSPPESVFKQLKPSHNRYTVLKDEL